MQFGEQEWSRGEITRTHWCGPGLVAGCFTDIVGLLTSHLLTSGSATHVYTSYTPC